MEKEVNIEKYDLEKYFEKYPDMPKEVIIKEDMMRFGFVWSDAALEAVKDTKLKTYYIFSYDRVDVKDMKQGEHLRAPEEMGFRGGPYNIRDTIVKNVLARKEDTPYSADLNEDGKVIFKWKGQYIADGFFYPRPKYYDYKFEDGEPYSDIAAANCGGVMSVCASLRSCQYWGNKHECKFCNINTAARSQSKTGRPFMIFKSVEQVAEVAEAIFMKERLPEMQAILLTGGAITSSVKNKGNVDFYREYIEAIREKIGGRWIVGVQTTALKKDDCKRLKDSGCDWHHSNIEVWDKKLFEIICPGKNEEIGRDEWIKRVNESVDVFGTGSVCPTFVTGVEMAQPFGFKNVDDAVKSLTEGLDHLMSYGVTPRLSSWTIEPGSALEGHKPISLDYYIKADRVWYELWRKHHLPPVKAMGPMGPGRASSVNSAHLDVGC